MFCVQCGAALQPGVQFCSICGRPAGMAFAAASPRGRIVEHIRLLAIFWFVLSGLRLLPGILLLTAGGIAGAFLPPDVPGFVTAILQVIGWFLIGGAAIGLACGWGLLQREPWGRMLALVLGCLGLIDIPFGTALGIYTLWVLGPTNSEAEYRQLSQAA